MASLAIGRWFLVVILSQHVAPQKNPPSHFNIRQHLLQLSPIRNQFGLYYLPNDRLNLVASSTSLVDTKKWPGEFRTIFEIFKRAHDSNRVDRTSALYDYDYETSQSSQVVGPHQVETINSEHYHKEVPPYDVGGFRHKGDEKHAEVHYHQHKHVHKHDHKQEHVHQHKQEHQHKHSHKQEHKHDHHSEHKHGHDHKHNHHQDHKHDHRAEHKHNHHNQHKHNHHHGHKHHSDNKHQHDHKHKHHSNH